MSASWAARSGGARVSALTAKARALVSGPADLTTPQGRAHERHRRAALSAGASAVAKLLSVSTALISVPLTIHYLGPERYGMWITLSSLVAMLSFADFGMGNGILNVIASAHGRDDRGAMRQAISSGFVVLSLLGMLILVAFLVIAPGVPWFRLFNVDSALARAEAAPAMLVFAACFAAALPLGIVQRVQMGLQRGFLSSLWQCAGSVMALATVLLAIHERAGLPWLVLAFMGAPLFAGLLNSLSFFGLVEPGLRPGLAHASERFVRQVVRSGGLFFILQIVASVTYSSDNIIIAQLLGAKVVPQYAVPERMFSLITMVLTMALSPLWPAYREAITRGDHAWVSQTLKRSLLLSLAYSVPLAVGMVACGPWLLNLWVGPSIHASWLLLTGLGAWKIIAAVGGALAMFLNGAHIIRAQVNAGILTAVTSILLELAMVRYIGVSGAVWATVIAYALFSISPLTIATRDFIRASENRNTP